MEQFRKLNDHIADAVENIKQASAELAYMIAKEEGEQLAAVGDASFAAPNMSTVVRLCQLYHERMMKDWMSDGRRIHEMDKEEMELRTLVADFFHAPLPLPILDIGSEFRVRDEVYQVTDFSTNRGAFGDSMTLNAHTQTPKCSYGFADCPCDDHAKPVEVTKLEPAMPLLLKFVFLVTYKNNVSEGLIEYAENAEAAEKFLRERRPGIKECVCRGIAAT